MTDQIPPSSISLQNMATDISPGYPELAKLMGAHKGMSIYLRFADLNARDLLVYQAEILQLQEQLDVHDQFNPTGRSTVLKLLGQQRTQKEEDHWKLQMELRIKLKDYNEALLRQAKIQQLGKPDRYDLDCLTGWLEREKGGNNFLNYPENLPWTEERVSDLVALSKREHDLVTKWISERLVPWLFQIGLTTKKPKPDDEELGLVEWSDDSYTTASRTTSIITSSLIPSLAIVVLYFIHSLLARIFVAMGLSFLFSITLALLTSARAAEIFASTAAFAAVLVVFIGSTSIGPSGNA
ncbi:hypothetical protein KCU67_g7170, partial [Aureobasidium melanogenum]